MIDEVQTEYYAGADGKSERKVGVIRINRPTAMNALNQAIMNAISEAIRLFEEDDSVGCIVLSGSEKVFAAGADIEEMKDFNSVEVFQKNFITKNWEEASKGRKPIIAAVAGFALGGGCEISMMCDMIFAADTAKFGQPEIKLGTMPGAGGTQRLPRAVGKAKAMDMCLTGRMIDAVEAERIGLVARIVPVAELLNETLKAAHQIAMLPMPTVMMIKESINRAYETTLAEGMLFERRIFYSTFSTLDQKEGMSAFVAKRKPDFKHK